MPSPFPGMDPYLEGHLWPDVHHGLASELRRQLVPRLRPRYVARIEVTVVEDRSPEAEVGILYPDVEVLRQGAPAAAPAPDAAPGRLPAPLTLPLLAPVTLRLPTVEVRDTRGDELVTAIEIISPVNKRKPQLAAYRERRERLRRAGVHLLEIDLIRRGTRPLVHAGLPRTAYLVTLVRAGARAVEAWPLGLADPLPTVPVPLRAPDPDSWLDLGEALGRVYEEAGYDLSLDYAAPPPPPRLSDEEEALRRRVLDPK